MGLHLIQPSLVMTDYRSFLQGTDDFYTSTSQSLSGRVAYKQTRYGLFANAFALQSWSHLPYTLAQQLYGNYVVYQYSPAQSDSKMFMAHGNIGKTVNFLKGSISVDGGYQRNESQLFSEQQAVASVTTGWNAGVKLGATFKRWLGLDYRFDYSETRLTMNETKNPWLGSMQHTATLNVFPSQKWDLTLTADYYRNELTSDLSKEVLLLDAKTVYKIGKHVELGAKLNNLFNKRIYHYISYSQLSSFESTRWLRGRELLVTLSLKK